jgi:hypothetical protein
VQLKIDPIVEMETPDQGKFVGPQSEYYRRYGTGASPNKLPPVATKAQYDALPPGAPYLDMRDGKPKRKSADPRSGVPAPATGKNGLPLVFTPAQYQATVESVGKAKTDAWMRQNNITVSER